MRAIQGILVLCAVLAATGCVSSKPVHYYTLRPAGGASMRNKADGVVLLIGRIVTPEALQDGRIRYRSGTNEAGAYEYHRWTEQPGDMVKDALMRTLRASGSYQRVIEAGSGATGDYVLRGKLQEFDEIDQQGAIQTRISLMVELVDRKTNRNIWDRMIEREEPVRSKTVTEVVQSLERNLNVVSGEVSTELERFLAGRH